MAGFQEYDHYDGMGLAQLVREKRYLRWICVKKPFIALRKLIPRLMPS